MPIPTPFHPRTSELCTSLLWKDWAGYFAVRSYGTSHEPEYYAIRHSAGLIDVSPLFKYEVRGRDAGRFLSRLTVRDVTKLKVGRLTYLCWCDDDGKVVDDGTVARLGRRHYRVTAAEPSLSWFGRLARGYRVTIEDASDRLGALALQGPTSRAILEQATGDRLGDLRFFASQPCRVGSAEVRISRTGYTGDLGYEIWVERDDALGVYDALLAAGAPYDLLPAGLDALDVARIEAGFVMSGVDYYSAHHVLTDERKSSPYELGLDWTVQLDRGPFVGQAALAAERRRGPKRRFVGLEVDWEEVEAVFESYGLPPEVPSNPWRDGRPVYDRHGRWIGQATSGAWSPTLKRDLALAQLGSRHAEPGQQVKIELTAEVRRHQVTATVRQTPFFDPPRKRAIGD